MNMIITTGFFILGCLMFMIGLVMWIVILFRKPRNFNKLFFWLIILNAGNIITQISNIIIHNLK